MSFEKLLMLYARQFPVNRGKLRLINSFWRIAAGKRGTGRLADLKYGGFKMRCDLQEMLQRQFYYFGTFFMEKKILDFWENESKAARVIFDVGANAGIYSLAALGAQPAADVYAFEPTSEVAAHLRETASRNGLGGLRVLEAAVYSENGRAILRRYRGESGENGGMNFISSDPGAGTEWVETVTLDRFCGDHGIDRIDLLKLDIQGHEYSALKGAATLLREGRIGTIFMELNWALGPDVACPASECVAILESMNYKFSAAGKRMVWKKSGAWMRNLTDVVARRA